MSEILGLLPEPEDCAKASAAGCSGQFRSRQTMLPFSVLSSKSVPSFMVIGVIGRAIRPTVVGAGLDFYSKLKMEYCIAASSCKVCSQHAHIFL